MRSTIRSLLPLALVLGCSPVDPPERPHDVDPPVAVATTDPVPAVASESAPASEPPLVTDGPALAGFVIYTEEQTVVVTPDGVAVVAEGLWVQDDRGATPALAHTLLVTRARADALELPACACLANDAACTMGEIEARRFDPVTGALLEAPDPACGCTRAPQPMGFPALDIDGEPFEACAGDDDELVASLVGGTLYALGWDWNGACHGGLSVYDAMSSEHPLIRDPPALHSADMRLLGCNNELGPAFTERPWPIDRAALTTDCEDYDESEAFMLRRGDLWGVRDNISGVHGFRRWFHRPARPDSCPSVNDPCGDPAAFHDRAKLDRRDREFWIATDGSLALTAVGHRYAIWSADAEAAVEFELPGIDAAADLLGVRSHADLRPLLAIIAKHPTLGQAPRPEQPSVVAPEVCLAAHGSTPGTARELGDLCFELLGVEQWAEAEAACLQGLERAVEPKTRGAILYNLGLIAKAQGAQRQAEAHFRSSLVNQPGNATVEHELESLTPP